MERKFWMVVIKPTGKASRKPRYRAKHRPTYRHETLAGAFAEAKRLAALTRRPFLVMETIGEVETPDGVDVGEIESAATEAPAAA